MHSLKACAEAQRRIPIGVAGQPPTARGARARARRNAGITIWHAVRMALRSIPRSGMPCGIYPAMQILALNALKPEPMGDGGDLLTREHRQREDRYLEKFAAWQAGGQAKENAQDIASEWLAAMPQALRGWMQKTLEGENTDAP